MELTPRQKRRAMIRWLWIVPCTILVWYAMLALGMALDSLATRFCPEQSLVSGFCTAAWFPTAERSIMIGCAGLAALAIVVVAAVIAPLKRLGAAAVMFVAGMGVALNMVSQTHAYAEFGAAAIGGLLGVFIASRLKQSIEL
jgi:hypothetical protein